MDGDDLRDWRIDELRDSFALVPQDAVLFAASAADNIAFGREGAEPEAIIAAARHRSRPILLTAMAAILGMIPIAHQIFWGPMAYAIIGGLLVASVFTLTVLPTALSLMFEQK